MAKIKRVRVHNSPLSLESATDGYIPLVLQVIRFDMTVLHHMLTSREMVSADTVNSV